LDTRRLEQQKEPGRQPSLGWINDEVCDAVCAFAARYDAAWLIEKNGLRRRLDRRAA
jgi:hypothetical protein